MVGPPLSERLEYAILKIVYRDPSDAKHQDSWGTWEASVRVDVPVFATADLLSAFKRLWKRGVIRLTKPDFQRYHALEYSGRESDDNEFFYRGPFNATITDEGRSHWDRSEEPKTTVFISHIGEEKAIALRLQALIQAAFSNAFAVFVSSDPASLGGGEEWYHHILDHLAKAKVVLVLLSPESSDKQWINFEAGFGRGQRSSVVPIAFRGLSFDGLDYPLRGLQGYYLPDLAKILNEISSRMGVPLGAIDLAAAWDEIKDIQLELPAKKLALELHPTFTHPNWTCRFSMVNNGNRDVEPLEVTVWVPSAILASPYRPMIDSAILEVRERNMEGVTYTEITYRNHREPMKPDRFSEPERLVACLAPGMRSDLRHLFFEVRRPLESHELENPIRYKIVAKNIRPVERAITLKDKLGVPKS